MLEALMQRWGFWVVLLGSALEGEGTGLSAGALAHRGVLAWPWAVSGVLLGTVLASQAWFWLGRRFGTAYLERFPRLARQATRVRGFVARHGDLFVLALRFLYGLRAASVVWLGASGYPWRRFALLDALGAVLWTGLILGLGFGLGATLKALLGRSVRLWEVLLLALVLALTAWLVARMRRRAPRE